MKDIFKKINSLLNDNIEFSLVTIIAVKGSTPLNSGAMMMVLPDEKTFGTIGGGALEYKAVNTARNLLKKGIQNKIIDIDLSGKSKKSGLCGGRCKIFIQNFFPENMLYILGAGHVCQSLVRILDIINLPYTVIDHRKEFLEKDLFKNASETILKNNFANLFKGKKINEKNYIVIMTSEHRYDYKCLKQSLKTKAEYIGLMASKYKLSEFLKNLKKEKITFKKSRLFSPVGLDISASTAEEIALSIAAEIIKIKNGE